MKGPNGINLKKMGVEISEKKKKSNIESRKIPRNIEAFFLGPKGENTQFFTDLIVKSINSNHTARMQYQMEDMRHITRHMKTEKSFLDAQDKLER